MNIQDSIKYFQQNPYMFVKHIIGVVPTSQQAIILNCIPKAIKEKMGIVVKSGHGTGKTAMETWITIWFMTCFAYPKIIATAPTQHQLYDVYWSELAKWHKKSKVNSMFEWSQTKFINKEYPTNWFAVARTSNKPENMQGFHAEHLLFIIDEAPGVDVDIMEAIEGTQTQEGSIIMMFGNPTQISGAFFDAFNSKRKFYYTFTLNAEESPIVDKRYYEIIAAKFGRDSDVYRVRVLGEFPKAEPDTLIPLNYVEAAANRELPEPDSTVYEVVELGVDVARFGDDETVVYSRIGNVVKEEVVLRKRDLMEVSGAVMQVAHKYKNKMIIINVDDSGLGGGVTDRVKELATKFHRCEVFGVNNGSRAKDHDMYVNLGSEMWFFMREKIKEIRIPNDNDLIGQLSSRKYRLSSNGKHMLETKEQMKDRGLTSPDRADALILAFRSLIFETKVKGNRSFMA